MRKRKSLKKADDESDGSEPGAEPEEFQDSGEDWTPEADPVMFLNSLLPFVLKKYSENMKKNF